MFFEVDERDGFFGVIVMEVIKVEFLNEFVL